MRKIPTLSLLEDLRKAALHPRNKKLPVPMGSLEEDLARSVQKWELKQEGYLENEQGVKIDTDDFIWVRFRRVSVDVYAQISIMDFRLRLHNLICPAPKGYFTDHINRDKLDNRRSNLRVTTIRESNINRPYLRRKKTSIYNGVCRWRCGKYTYWKASLSFHGKHVSLGVRSTEEEAARLYNEKAPEYHGEFTQLNVIK